MNQQTDLKGQHNFMLFYFVYMWRTLPSFVALALCSGDLIILLPRTACLFTDGEKKKYLFSFVLLPH